MFYSTTLFSGPLSDVRLDLSRQEVVYCVKDWVGDFFPARTPAKDFLRLYSQRLNVVEGNTIFYALPSAATIAHWCEETPDTFRFCPKVSRSISHEAGLAAKRVETLAFAERMRGLGTRLGPIFLQLPPTFTPAQLPQLKTFLDYWPSDLRLAVEVRHPAFFTPQHTTTLNTLIADYNVARIILDTRPLRTGTPEEQQLLQARERKPHLPVELTTTADFAFVRYIGHPDMQVNEPWLESWSRQVAQWLQEGLTVYAFCHCPFEEHSPAICHAFYERVRALRPLPELTWQGPDNDAGPEQLQLF